MKINIEKKIYMYGKPQIISGGDDISELDKITIYIAPTIFDKVPLSSLEGYFIAGESDLPTGDAIEDLIPRITLRREYMSKFARKHHGKFCPFPKY